MRFQSPRGTQDILPSQAAEWRAVEATFRRVCADFGYGEIRTPAFESAGLFVRAVGEHTDIVSKEMFRVSGMSREEGGEAEQFALRPEGTAPTLRAYVQHNLGAETPVTKLFYIAPNFRYERPQAGRLRQHHQTGIEALGSEDPALDVEVVLLGLTYLERLGITGHELLVNSVGCRECRPAFREALVGALEGELDRLCGNCRRRCEVNPLRVLDCKVEDWERLEPLLPSMQDHLCEPCSEHFREFRELLSAAGAPHVLAPRLVRGLDYYVRTSFEIVHPHLGAQSTLLGGGRYDGLVAELGGAPTPGIGFGCGIERVLLAAEALGRRLAAPTPGPVHVITLGASPRRAGLLLLHRLRRAGVPADIDYLGRSMKAQMRAANRAGAAFAVLLGESEMEAGTAAVKDLRSGDQTNVPLEEVPGHLLARLPG